jgi:hypothetical protein
MTTIITFSLNNRRVRCVTFYLDRRRQIVYTHAQQSTQSLLVITTITVATTTLAFARHDATATAVSKNKYEYMCIFQEQYDSTTAVNMNRDTAILTTCRKSCTKHSFRQHSHQRHLHLQRASSPPSARPPTWQPFSVAPILSAHTL